MQILLGLSFLTARPVHAEPPMNVDDASTLGRGGMKIEAAWLRDDMARGPDLAFGYSPLDGLELALNAGLAHDHADHPSTRTRAYGLSAKWVPWTADAGWSAGVSLNLGHARVHDRATPHRHTERNQAIVGLVSYVFEAGHKLHFNLGQERQRAGDRWDAGGLWGLGFEWAFSPGLQLTLESFGTSNGRPDKSLGLRYGVAEGFKISAAVGRGNDRGFGQAGFAWEF